MHKATSNRWENFTYDNFDRLTSYCFYRSELGFIRLIDINNKVYQRYSFSNNKFCQHQYYSTSSAKTKVLFIYDFNIINHTNFIQYQVLKIHMNARLYDPVKKMFLQPDNILQDPYNPQNYNRFGYCLNNPLKYTDPSGNNPLLIAALVGGFINVVFNAGNINNVGDFFKYFAVGAISGLAGYGAGTAVTASVGSLGFIAGATTGAASGAAAGFVSGFGNSLVGGASFSDALGAGVHSGIIGAATGAAIGGISGGIQARKMGGDFWTGEFIQKTYADVTSSNTGGEIKVGEGMDYSDKYTQDFVETNKDAFGQNVKFKNNIQPISTNDQAISNSGFRKVEFGHVYDKGREVLGVTKWTKLEDLKIYLFKAAYTSKANLLLTVGHEFYHAAFASKYASLLAIANSGNNYYKEVKDIEHYYIYGWEKTQFPGLHRYQLDVEYGFFTNNFGNSYYILPDKYNYINMGFKILSFIK